MRSDQEEMLRRMASEWEISSLPPPDKLAWFLAARDLLAKLRELGFAVAACSWCALVLPRGEEARCPVCECLVGRGGRRRFQRPSVFGVPVPDGGFSSEEKLELLVRATRAFADERLGEALSAVASRGPKN